MKTTFLCFGIGGLAFVLASFQSGFLQEAPSARPSPTEDGQTEPSLPRATFPEDLAPAARAEPVPRAALFERTAKVQRLAVLKSTGAIYQDWQDQLREDWL